MKVSGNYTMVTGEVTRVELKERKPFRVSPYSQAEVLEFYADVELETEAGTVYFKSKPVKRAVTMGGPFAVVCYIIPHGGHDFLVEVGENAVAEAGKPNDNHLELTVAVGDRITVTGRVKADRVSRKGRAYRVLTHVKREDSHATS